MAGSFDNLVFNVSYGAVVWRVSVAPALWQPRTRPEAVLHPHDVLVNGEPARWRVDDFRESTATLAVEAEMRPLWSTPLRVAAA